MTATGSTLATAAIDVGVGHLALHHLQAGIFDRTSTVPPGRTTPATDGGDAAADRAVGGDEALEWQRQAAPSSGPAIADTAAGAGQRRVATGISRSGWFEHQRRAPCEILQHRDDGAACPTFPEQFTLNAIAECSVALSCPSCQPVAEVVVCDDVQPDVGCSGDARLCLHVLQLLVSPAPAGREAAQQSVQHGSTVREPACRQHGAQPCHHVLLVARHVSSPRSRRPSRHPWQAR